MKQSVFAVAIAIGVLGWNYPQNSFAAGFAGADFLRWPVGNQAQYLQVSITMAGVIASQNNLDWAKCVDNWHARENRDGYRAVIASIRKFPGYHPQTIVLGSLNKACGKLN